MRPFAEAGAAAVVIDHTPLGQGNRANGSQRKRGAVDVELQLAKIGVGFRPNKGGRVKISVGRDRDAAIVPCEFVLEPEMTWRLEEGAAGANGDWRPTVLMAKVSRYLEAQTVPVSRSTVERDVEGKAQYLRQAIDLLIAQGFVDGVDGPRNSVMCVSRLPYPAGSSTPSDSVPTPSGTESTTASTPSLLSREDGDGVDS
jgi:hypothetical protein